jgi:hypothetical protein
MCVEIKEGTISLEVLCMDLCRTNLGKLSILI